MTKKQYDIVIYTMVITIVAVMLVGVALGVYLGNKFNNYLFLSLMIFVWIKLIRESIFKDKISKLVYSKYPYTTKVVVQFVMIITFILSWWSIISFFIYTIMSYYYIEFGKWKELKEKTT